MTTTTEPSTSTAPLPPVADPGPPDGLLRRARRLLGSARTRIVAWFLLLLVLAGAVALLATRQVLLVRVQEQIDRELVQESEELRRLATEGTDPRDNEPFGPRVDRLFDVFLARNLPDRDEIFLTFVGGGLYEPSIGQPIAPLNEEPAVVRQLASVTSTERGRLNTERAGAVEYLAVPVEYAGETRGVFAVLVFREPRLAEVNDVTRLLVGVGGVVFLLAAPILWGVAGRILAPVRELTLTARTITDTDLSRRIEVRGDDEVSELTRTVNAMLDRLEAAFISQRDFVNDAGHELRTPITIVRGHLELLGHDPSEHAETIPLLLDELDRMSRFVDDLLILAKAQRPDFLDLETVDVEALTGDLVAKARTLGDRDWVLEGTGRARMVADRQRLTQAVMQLAANATQHTADGDTIALGSAVQEREVRLWVRDTGSGIRQADQERVFERFARGGGGRQSSGAGLGLAIVKAIAEAHRGRVELRSSPGAGATFTLVLPIDQPEADTLELSLG